MSSGGARESKAEREKRLAEALRANLRRRKQQAKAHKAQSEESNPNASDDMLPD